jgi:hypothetical protein
MCDLVSHAVIDHQHPVAVRRRHRISQQQLQSAGIDPPRIPHRDSGKKNCSRCTVGSSDPFTFER